MTLFDTSYYKALIAEAKCLDKFRLGSGCCVICFNSNPLVLVEHHPFGQHNNNEFTITVCANHHEIFNRLQRKWPQNWLISGPKTKGVILALQDRAIADLLKVKDDYLLGLD